MGILTRGWLTKPTWGDYIVLMIGWAVLFVEFIREIILTADDRSVWLSILYVVLLVLLYAIMAISGYFHVKSYKKGLMAANKSDPEQKKM